MKRKKASRQQLGGTSFADLPSHIITHILHPLPIKSILICKRVCKTWKALISDPHFAKLHFEGAPVSFMIRTNDDKRVSRTLYLLPELSEIECNDSMKLEPRFKLPLRNAKSILEKYESRRPVRAAAKLVLEKSRQSPYIACKPNLNKFDVVSSCNGLLCLSGPLHEGYKIPIVICNPLTGEFINVPEAPRTKFNTGHLLRTSHLGFGFQPQTNEYKVIKMWKRYGKIANDWNLYYEGSSLEIYTLGNVTSRWKTVEVDPVLGSSISWLEFPTCMNGVLHWINRQRSILCFNFESERFQFFPSPPQVFGNKNNRVLRENVRISMGESKGFLYLGYTHALQQVTMWVMKKYGDGESWTRAYNISCLGRPLGIKDPPYRLCLPVKHPEEGLAVMLYHSSKIFFYYEPEKSGFNVFQLNGTQSKLVDIIPHRPSLLSLKDIVKGGNFEVLNIYSRCAKFKLEEENEVLYFD